MFVFYNNGQWHFLCQTTTHQWKRVEKKLLKKSSFSEIWQCQKHKKSKLSNRTKRQRDIAPNKKVRDEPDIGAKADDEELDFQKDVVQKGLPNEDDSTPSDPNSVSSEPPHKALIINMDEQVVEDLTHDFISTAKSTTVADDLSADFNGFKDYHLLRPKGIESDTVNIEDSTEVVDQVEPKALTVRSGRHQTLFQDQSMHLEG